MHNLIDVESVWRKGTTGAGVHIRFNHDGVNGDHPELSARFVMRDYMPYDLAGDTHGTSCAAIAADESNDDECSASIATGATVSSYAIITYPNLVTPEYLDGYSFFVQGVEYVNIFSSNSWVTDISARLPFRRCDEC